ncbi:hypothetical protein NQ314_012012 [Rhamnusium bicolor]|uniref:Retrotransposon gag domain-containing protein n=1 Tax=Rhamnusium bicolor TaxID=1586634 RepID=A0AAV8XFI8_9CUCU|nr:hypothetical protein NQ314_012012 [Rhamnusium bicolor]
MLHLNQNIEPENPEQIQNYYSSDNPYENINDGYYTDNDPYASLNYYTANTSEYDNTNEDYYTANSPSENCSEFKMPGEIKLDVNRLTKEELGYELRVRGLGEGGNLTVVEMRAVLRNALHLEKTSLAIKSPTYPYKFAEDSVALTVNLDTVNSLIDEFCGIANDTVDRLQEKTKKDRKTRDSTVFDLSVLRQIVGQPGAHSSAMEAEHSSSDEKQVVKLKPVPVRDWGLKFTGRPGDMSFTTFLERVEEKLKNWATDWESLIELMREQFLPENFDMDLFEEIKRRTQGSQDSIGLYMASMIGLFNKMRTPIAEETQLEMILERIDPYYHPFLAFKNITSVTQLLTYCRKLDVKRGLAKSYIPPPPKKKSLVPVLMVTQCKVANGQMCASIGYVSTPVTLGDKARIIDILVIPELPHKLILGVDFWVSMNIIPDLRQRIWHLSNHEPSTEVCSILDETSLNPNQKSVLEQLVESNRKLMDPENRKLAFARIFKDVQAKLSKASKHRYNLRRRLDRFFLNQKVWRRSQAQSDATKYFSAKLAPKFVGPFTISKIVSPWTYELKDLNGKRTVWHIKDLNAHPPDSE